MRSRCTWYQINFPRRKTPFDLTYAKTALMRATSFRLRFPESQLAEFAERYSYTANDGELNDVVRPTVRARGHLEREEFLQICRWKTARSKSRVAGNNQFTVRTITRAAFATKDESLKMDLLRTLDGVEWPTASTLLHFCDEQPYPILDYRALWSLGYDKPPHYTMESWLAYLDFTRRLAKRLRQEIRTIDRALWQCSKEQQ
jgi:hypothetical protein